MVHEFRALLQAAGVAPPFVVVGHSFGGMLARIFATEYPTDVVGMVLVDSSSEEQLHGKWGLLERGVLVEAGTRLDMAATERQLEADDLGSLPLVVLSRGRPEGPPWADRLWAAFQRNLAALSTDSVHVVALDSGHLIQIDQPALVEEAIDEVVKAAVDGQELQPCGPRFTKLRGRCLAS
jgi:pimeloyl-ACP methyl ester carboxylesterase